MKTIQQIKDCQAIDLGYNSFRGLVLNPKKDMALDHLNLCIERSMKEYAKQESQEAIEMLKDIKNHLSGDEKKAVEELLEEINIKELRG